LLLTGIPDDRLPMPIDEGTLEPADRWILGRLSATTRLVTDSFGRFEFGPAIEGLLEFAWHEFADDYLELIKPRLQAGGASGTTARAVAIHVHETTLRLLHPVMPFITEELWQRIPHEGKTIMLAPWPLADERLEDHRLLEEMAHLLEVVRAIRSLRHASDPTVRRQAAEIQSPRSLLLDAARLSDPQIKDLYTSVPDSSTSERNTWPSASSTSRWVAWISSSSRSALTSTTMIQSAASDPGSASAKRGSARSSAW